MNLVGRAFGSVSKTWNSINPATLSGAIDVVCVEQENGDLACSPFHVEFKVNNERVPYSMKVGDGGEAFFVFQTDSDVPEDLRTSPIVSPVGSPDSTSGHSGLQEPDYFDLNEQPESHLRANSTGAMSDDTYSKLAKDDARATLHGAASGSAESAMNPKANEWQSLAFCGSDSQSSEGTDKSNRRHTVNAMNFSDEDLDRLARADSKVFTPGSLSEVRLRENLTPHTKNALQKAEDLMRRLAVNDIPTHITDAGDVMLDMHGYKSSEEDLERVGAIADHIAAAEELSQELLHKGEDPLMTADESGNLWIYATPETKQSAMSLRSNSPGPDSCDENPIEAGPATSSPSTPPADNLDRRAVLKPRAALESNYNYAKTLRLTSEQLKSLRLKTGENTMSFAVNGGKAICTASLFYWRYDSPIVISDIDGTITKSDALGHLFNMVGRDWTHPGVAKLYTDIKNNGYNWLYLSSRSVGQADTTRNYLKTIAQDKFRLPRGPVILSPDRTIAALRREMILRKPEVFKMQCLRDLSILFGQENKPFHAGFGNRITDAISYRYVGILPSRIFTINSTGDVHMELLQYAGYRSSYVSMSDLVDHFFPPIQTNTKKGEQDFTDFTFWRAPLPKISPEPSESGYERKQTTMTKLDRGNQDDDDDDEDPDYEPSEGDDNDDDDDDGDGDGASDGASDGEDEVRDVGSKR